MANILRKICPICGRNNTDNEELFHRDFRGMNALAPFSLYHVYTCKECGLIYAGDIEESMSLSAYYQTISKYERPGWGASSEVSVLDRFAADYISNYMKKFSMTPDVSFLDIGCGAGGLLVALKNRGYPKIYGLEPSTLNAQTIKNRHDIDVYVGGLGDHLPELSKRKFDVISMKGVLEHLLDIKENLKEAISYLKSDGKIYIEVPDADLFAENSNLYQEFSVEHVNFFDRSSLSKLFQSFGFYLEDYRQDKKYSVLMSLWSRSTAKNRIQSYLKDSESLGKRIAPLLQQIDTPYYIWGAGTHTAMLYQLGYLKEELICGIIDTNPNYTGKSFYGHSIVTPKEIRDDAPILISTQNAQKEIRRSIQEDYHLKNPILVLYENI